MVVGSGRATAAVGLRGTRSLPAVLFLHVEVKAVESSENLDVYNLEVADFNTYFVGQSQVLTHDVTVRQPTDMLLPGLAKTEVVAP